MSQLSAVDVQIQVVWNNYVELAAFAILVYDYLLTLDLEVERFWKWDTTGLGSVLFYINRYLTLLGNVPIVVFFFWPEPVLRHNGCHALETYQQFFLSIVQLFISILFILRVYAIYGASRRIAAFLSVVATAMVGNGLLQWYLSGKAATDVIISSPETIKQTGCLQSYTTAQGLHMVYLWLGVVTLDICVFSLTIWKTLMMRKDVVPGGMATVIMRDGAMYFGIIALINSANILFFALGTGFMKGLLPIFANIFASVMMSHLMLNLREGQTTEKPDSVLPAYSVNPCSLNGMEFRLREELSSMGTTGFSTLIDSAISPV